MANPCAGIPRRFVRRIWEMRNEDGHLLVENIFISNVILAEAAASTMQWSGVNANTRLRSETAHLDPSVQAGLRLIDDDLHKLDLTLLNLSRTWSQSRVPPALTMDIREQAPSASPGRPLFLPRSLR